MRKRCVVLLEAGARGLYRNPALQGEVLVQVVTEGLGEGLAKEAKAEERREADAGVGGRLLGKEFARDGRERGKANEHVRFLVGCLVGVGRWGGVETEN